MSFKQPQGFGDFMVIVIFICIAGFLLALL